MFNQLKAEVGDDDWEQGKKDGHFELAWEIRSKILAGWTTEQLLEYLNKVYL